MIEYERVWRHNKVSPLKEQQVWLWILVEVLDYTNGPGLESSI
jgi:hypothetical protein